MYSPELEWLLGNPAVVQQRKELTASAVSGCSTPALDSLHRATALDSTVDGGHTLPTRPLTTRAAERPRCTSGFYTNVQVIGGLAPRGPREPSDTFSTMPCRFL
ncbi:hypothetical protein Q4I30_004583 [Leishmania utingensis]|uniref:Uncharacterized protein n=2 Tax=Viannia TaxID=37616 RepID=A0AAW3ACM3_9TRYP